LHGRQEFVLVARRGGEIVGLLPLYGVSTPLIGRQLRLMGDGVVGSDYLGAIAESEHLSAVSAAFASRLAELPVDLVELDGLLADDPLVAAITASPRAQAELRYTCPYIRTRGDFDEYLSTRPEGVGQQFRRRLRTLQRLRGFGLEVLTSPDEIGRGMEVLFALHRRRWALAGGSDGIPGARVEAFHREAARGLARLGWARLFLLHVDGAPRAALYAWMCGGRLAFYQSGHEPAWRSRSVGTVLLGLVIRACFADGLSEFDFMHGSELYKLRWATDSRQTVRVRLRGEGLRPELYAATRRCAQQLRVPVSQMLPRRARTVLRRLRRARELS
jgi:CelD/BcsL family acetyltransferase involved in cellulose biosynthesis